MRVGVALIVALTVLAPLAVNAQAPAKEKGKTGKMVLLCPKQQNGGKVNVTCKDGEKCCYQPLFDTGECVPEGQGCMGIVNPLPRISR